MPTFKHQQQHRLWTVSFFILMGCFSCVTAQSQPTFMPSQPVVTLRTLAQIQQWQDEMNLRDRIDTLQDKVRTRGSQQAQAASIARGNARTDAALMPSVHLQADSAGSSRRQQASYKRRPALKLLSVYGPAHRLSAEAMDAGGNLHAIEERDTVGAWVVQHIRQEGILLHRDGKGGADKRGIFLAVGESIHEPAGESGAGSATESVTAGVRP